MNVDLSEAEIAALRRCLSRSDVRLDKKLKVALTKVRSADYEAKMEIERPHLWRNRRDNRLYYLEQNRNYTVSSIAYYGGTRRVLNRSSWKLEDFYKVAKV